MKIFFYIIISPLPIVLTGIGSGTGQYTNKFFTLFMKETQYHGEVILSYVTPTAIIMPST